MLNAASEMTLDTRGGNIESGTGKNCGPDRPSRWPVIRIGRLTFVQERNRTVEFRNIRMIVANQSGVIV